MDFFKALRSIGRIFLDGYKQQLNLKELPLSLDKELMETYDHTNLVHTNIGEWCRKTAQEIRSGAYNFELDQYLELIQQLGELYYQAGYLAGKRAGVAQCQRPHWIDVLKLHENQRKASAEINGLLALTINTDAKLMATGDEVAFDRIAESHETTAALYRENRDTIALSLAKK